MTMKQARGKYRRAVQAHRISHPHDEMAVSFRVYARWLCVGDIVPTGKLHEICVKQAKAGAL